MSNPLDDALAQAEAAKQAAELARDAKELATQQAAHDWLEAYREVLAELPPHLKSKSRGSKEITMAWPPGDKPLGSVTVHGEGRDQRKSLFHFGTCDAYLFPFGRENEDGRRPELYVSADCSAVFRVYGLINLRHRTGLRSQWISATHVGGFIDIGTSRHALVQTVYPDYPQRTTEDEPTESNCSSYDVLSSNLPSARQLAQIIAGIAMDPKPSVGLV